MTWTATILADDAQADGRRYVRVRFDEDVSLVSVQRLLRMSAGADAQAMADALVPEIEESEKQLERQRGAGIFLDGGDIDAETWHHSTLPRVRAYAGRQLLNLLRDEVPADFKGDLAVRVLPYFTSKTNAHWASIIQTGAWTPAKIGAVKADLTAAAAAMGDLDHGEPETPDW